MTGKPPTDLERQWAMRQRGERLVPWHQGELPVVGIPPLKDTETVVSPGRWTLSPQSTVPYAKIKMGEGGDRQLTWGQMVEVPDGKTGRVGNASYHQGDVILIAVGTGVGWSAERPGRVTVVTKWRSTATQWQTEWIDTRLARRCFLANVNLSADFSYTVELEQPTGSAQVVNASGSRTLTFTETVVGYRNLIAMGYLSGADREPAPGTNTLPEVRPMILLDRVRMTVPLAVGDGVGIATTTNAFFVLEY